MINPPFALNNPVKSRQAALWIESGLPCASAEPAADKAALRSIIGDGNFPVILRFDDRHMQDGASVCRNQAEALDWLLGNERYPVAMLDFIDTRDSWRREQPGSVFAEFFHKRRSMVFGSRVINNHTLLFVRADRGARKPALSARPTRAPTGSTRWSRPTSLFFTLRPEQPELMQAAVRALGLGMAAIDYSTQAGGSIVLWEANPFFQLPHWSNGLLAGPRRLEQRVPKMIDSMIDELEALAGGAVDG